MVGRQSSQMSMKILDLSELIPENHLIYDPVAPCYPANGCPSVDNDSMFKILLVGCLYVVKSERRFVQEFQLNIAYRWFCRFELIDKVQDHSTFSKTRLCKWNKGCWLQEVFWKINRRCVKSSLIDRNELTPRRCILLENFGGSSYPAFYRGNERMDSDTYWHIMRLHKICAKRSFSVLKRYIFQR